MSDKFIDVSEATLFGYTPKGLRGPKIGDLFEKEIDGKMYYMLYMGFYLDVPLVRIFSSIDCKSDSIVIRDFSVGILPAIRKLGGGWKRIKRGVPITERLGPVLHSHDCIEGFRIWALYDDSKVTVLGKTVPEQYQDCNDRSTMSYEALERSIKDGIHRGSYRWKKDWPLYPTHSVEDPFDPFFECEHEE
jgi:hypothetical protein